MQRSLNLIWCWMGAICILHLCRWSGSDLPPLCWRSSALAGFSYQGLSTRADLSGSLKPDVTLHRIFLKPVTCSWAVLGTEPNPEVKGKSHGFKPWGCGHRGEHVLASAVIGVRMSASLFWKPPVQVRLPDPHLASESGAFWAPTDRHVSISWAREQDLSKSSEDPSGTWLVASVAKIYSGPSVYLVLHTQILLWLSALSFDLHPPFLQSWVLCD